MGCDGVYSSNTFESARQPNDNAKLQKRNDTTKR